ncbi:GSCFA domain-containing protein [Salipiger thiooxidans]|uniref:GSCFA domain-containing protein n=1 Tax=Salipiger thiooxidans TaxID=282683 RepID=UPI001A8FC302|nr:GSCFA domain-containing protein [Salipiger thiooxidans]MBN8189909.1 GSCFA domain-containing protein [Salipiger thiooxidans]
MNPYENLPPKAFWRRAVAENSMYDVSGLWNPKFKLSPKMPVSTYGSCFAQHIGRALQARGFNWLRTETAPFGMSGANRLAYNYDVFSSRTGNIYTTSLLLQWLQWAFGIKPVPEEIWEKGGRFYDPFRPRVEPDGFASVEELRASQQQTLKSFRESVTQADVFVFTLGLTERWLNSEKGYEYPMCPGTVAGEFDEAVHQFDNMIFSEVQKNLYAALKIMREQNEKLRVILTVSPVPLTATNSGKHVLVATMQSKSVLRAVAGQTADGRWYVDYFPSYEIINSPVFRGNFFEPNQRNVAKHGVNFVMDSFFRDLNARFGRKEDAPAPAAANPAAAPAGKKSKDEVCEEELLEAFAAGGRK